MSEAEVSNLADRMDGDYQPPILAEPAGGPIPEPSGDDVTSEKEPPEPE